MRKQRMHISSDNLSISGAACLYKSTGTAFLAYYGFYLLKKRKI